MSLWLRGLKSNRELVIPLEACMTSSVTMKASTQGRGFEVRPSWVLWFLCVYRAYGDFNSRDLPFTSRDQVRAMSIAYGVSGLSQTTLTKNSRGTLVPGVGVFVGFWGEHCQVWMGKFHLVYIREA